MTQGLYTIHFYCKHFNEIVFQAGTLEYQALPTDFTYLQRELKIEMRRLPSFVFFFIFHKKLEYFTFLNNRRHFCFLYKHFPLLPFDFCFLLYCIYLWSAGTVHTCIRNTTYMYILFLKQNEDTKDLFKIS